MRALGILGTSSGVGKTWMTTAVCAWLRREGVRVAPCKVQNMSNNACATLDGREMARAQAVQAEACGLLPHPDMNPVLLKPTTDRGAQVVFRGEVIGHREASDYFRDTEGLWRRVVPVLDGWRDRCDVLVMEGAGSPVELNLMDRDLANLRPVRHLDGRWLLVADIDRGGVFAQLAGTHALLPEADRGRCLGAVVNRFRGDLSLFQDPNLHLGPHAPGLRVLGTVPLRRDLQPEEEDGLGEADQDRGSGDVISWIRLPRTANLGDCQPWWDDAGVRTRWVGRPADLAGARAIVLPGTRNTIGDLRWLRESGLAEAVAAAARAGVPVVGLCGGYQMLGQRLRDPDGVAGDAGDEAGLGLLPVVTEFSVRKLVRQVSATWGGRTWRPYEIHMGRTTTRPGAEALVTITPDGDGPRPEGCRVGTVAGTYLHGFFEVPETRAWLARLAGIQGHVPHPVPWAERRQGLYAAMADHLVAHVDLDPVRRWVGL